MADFKETRDRIFAMSGAILFFVTSVALSVIVVVQLVQESNQKKEAKKLAESSQQATKPDGKKLEGTKLADFTPVEKVEKVETTDLTPGTGKEIKSVSDEITAHYTGALAVSGVIFQSSLDSGKPFTTTLDGVIKGWQTGMIGMKEGGKRRILIPAADAYGSQAQNNIPANSDLVFDITLIKVK